MECLDRWRGTYLCRKNARAFSREMDKASMKVGDLVYDSANGWKGIILRWLKTGGPEPSLWEVLYENGEIDSALENELEVINGDQIT